MDMILYLTSQQHMNLLDFYSQKEDGKPIKKMIGNFVLKKFVVYDMRNFSHCSELVLDRLAFGDSDEAFVEAIVEFQTMYQARVTVIVEGLSEPDGLFQGLLDAGVGNIVTEPDIERMQEEICLCFCDSGLGKYHVREKKEAYCEGDRYTFLCSRVQIAVVGAQNRIGTTTVALGLANWINMAGGTACYVEGNDSGHMECIAEGYEMETEGGGYMLDGVGYYREQPEREYQFIINDFGVNIPQTMQDILILVCGTKPYELPDTIRLLQYYREQELIILFPFVANGLRETYKKAFQTSGQRVLFLNYQPDCLEGLPNAGIYKNIVRKYIGEG